MTKETKALQSEFDSIDQYLIAAQETLRQGHMPNMAGLDSRIAELCAAIEKSEQDTQQLCLPKLGELLHKIDACEEAIRSFHDAKIGRAQ